MSTTNNTTTTTIRIRTIVAAPIAFKQDTEHSQTLVKFRTENGQVYTIAAHPAIRWGKRLNQTFELKIATGEQWKLVAAPSPEELAAYEAKKNAEATREATSEELKILATF